MKKVFLGLLSITLLSLPVCAETADEKVQSQNREILRMVVEDISKKTPQKIDDYTTLESVRSEDQTLIYIYAINTGAKSDKAVKKDDRERMRRAVTKGSCQSSARFLNSGIELTYIYQNAATKAELFQFHVNKKRCKKLF